MYASELRARLDDLNLEMLEAESVGLTELRRLHEGSRGGDRSVPCRARGRLRDRDRRCARPALRAPLRLTARSRSMSTAFVLSGGASLGAMQVGMLRALYERGIAPDLLVGTSAGALNAAFVASRPQTVTTANQLARAWMAMRREEIFPWRSAPSSAGCRAATTTSCPIAACGGCSAGTSSFDSLEHTAIPLHLVAFDVMGGREVLLSEGPALEALLAAAAIPGVLPPVPWGDQPPGGRRRGEQHADLACGRAGRRPVYVLPTSAGPGCARAAAPRRPRRGDPRSVAAARRSGSRRTSPATRARSS